MDIECPKSLDWFYGGFAVPGRPLPVPTPAETQSEDSAVTGPRVLRENWPEVPLLRLSGGKRDRAGQAGADRADGGDDGRMPECYGRGLGRHAVWGVDAAG